MYKSRLLAYKKVSRQAKKSVDIRPRHKILLGIEGWYDASVDPSVISPNLLVGWDGKTKITRWLLREGRVTQQQATELGQKLKPAFFKLSCRHNDLLCLGETHHYRTCYKITGAYNYQPLRFLADPDIAVAYMPDAAGKFIWRSLIRLVLHPKGGFALVKYKSYGNANDELILNSLVDIMPLYLAGLRDDRGVVELASATKVTNPAVSRVLWSDHPCLLRGDRLHMWATPYDKKVTNV